jgi:D-methionine transport system ATP-binding protein
VALLKFDQVTMRASTGIVEILKNISFALESGDFVALVGPSGSGKTSLLRLINRLSEASTGHIYFAGTDIRTLNVVSLRQQVALVQQESRLLEMTVAEALAYPLRLQQKRSASDITAAVALWADRLAIPDDWMNRTAQSLSLGQRQRVAIARALVSEPTLLLLDEPTSSQDVGYSEFLLSRLADLTRQGKLTIIMANHQVALAGRYANRLWHLNDGRLIKDLPAAEVNWAELRQALVAAEQAAQAEWD